MLRLEKIVGDLCAEIDQLNEIIDHLEKDRDYYKNKYIETVQSNIEHGQRMMTGMLQLALQRDGVK